MEKLPEIPIVVLDRAETLPALGSITSAGIPCVGHTRLGGMAYAAGAATLLVELGVNDKLGVLTYRQSVTQAIGAGSAVTIDIPIAAKFLRVSITDTSGAPNAIEIWLAARNY